MEKLTITPTTIFARLFDLLGNKQELELSHAVAPTVTVQYLQQVSVKGNTANMISLSLTSYEDALPSSNPEIRLLVIDQRVQPDDYAHLRLYPCFFCMEAIDVLQWSMVISNEAVTHVNQPLQSLHCSLAGSWLLHLAERGYLDEP